MTSYDIFFVFFWNFFLDLELSHVIGHVGGYEQKQEADFLLYAGVEKVVDLICGSVGTFHACFHLKENPYSSRGIITLT